MQLDVVEKGTLVWFDPGIGYQIPGQVVDFSQYHNVISIKSNLGGKVRLHRLDTLEAVWPRTSQGKKLYTLFHLQLQHTRSSMAQDVTR